MLKDPILNESFLGKIFRIEEGIYSNCNRNFLGAIQWNKQRSVNEPQDGFPPYGVADSIEQFMSLFGKQLRESKQMYAVGFTELLKSHELEEGFSWNGRDGEYYGLQKPQAVYLLNEPEIEKVVCFEIRGLLEECTRPSSPVIMNRPKHMLLHTTVIDDFNVKCDDEIEKLRELGVKADRKYNHALARGYFERSNELENMKRMLNHYSETGEIKIPD